MEDASLMVARKKIYEPKPEPIVETKLVSEDVGISRVLVELSSLQARVQGLEIRVEDLANFKAQVQNRLND